MIHAVIRALREQNVTEDKIDFITQRLDRITGTASGNAVWRTLCESCLEVGIDPQTLFMLAFSYREEACDDLNAEEQ